jgi:adenylate kinase family enzyme
VKGVVDPASAAARIRSADKVHVVGGPGVGKSSFAAALARACNLELHRLDETAFGGPDFRPRPDEVTLAAARAIAEETRWVAEGIFVGWVDPLFESADVIVWLDHVTWSAAARRIASRWFRQAIREPVVRRGTERFFRFRDYGRNLRHLVRVVVTSHEYWSNSGQPRRYTVTRAQLRSALAPHEHKVIHVTRLDEAETMLRLIEPARDPR